MATQLLNDGETDAAIRECSRALELDPDFYKAYILRALALMELGKNESAYTDACKAVSLNSDDWNSWLCLGQAQQRVGLREQALQSLTRTLELIGARQDVYRLRGNVHSELGQYERAIADYSEAIRLMPEKWVTYNNYAYLLATCPDEAFRDGPRAVALAEKAVALRADSITLDTLAAAYARAGRFEDAVKTQKKAVDWRRKIEGLPVPEGDLKRLREYQAGRPWTEEPSARP